MDECYGALPGRQRILTPRVVGRERPQRECRVRHIELFTIYDHKFFYTLLDRIDYVLSPDIGLLGVVDFYTSGKQPSLHE